MLCFFFFSLVCIFWGFLLFLAMSNHFGLANFPGHAEAESGSCSAGRSGWFEMDNGTS